MEKLACTSNQILIGTFLGGPLAGIYFLKKNFDAMGDKNGAQKTIQYGLIFFVTLLAALPFLPQFIPSFVYGVAYAAAARAIYEQYHKIMLKDNPRYTNWNVAGVALLSVIAFLIILVPMILVYNALGLFPVEETSSL